MKKLPEYLDKPIEIMANAAARLGIYGKEEAVNLFKKELFDESLTAKANPGPVGEKNAKVIITEKQKQNAGSDREGIAFYEIPHMEFLKLTTKNDAEINDLRNDGKLKSVDEYNQYAKEDKFNVHPHLEISPTGKIIAHEGRHRAIAEMDTGEKLYRIAIVANYHGWNPEYGKRWYRKLPVPASLTGQYNDYVHIIDQSKIELILPYYSNPAKKNPKKKSVKSVVDSLVAKGQSANQIHSTLLRMGYRGSKASLVKYLQKNPRKSIGHTSAEFDPKELDLGTEHEMEHTDDPHEAYLTAMDHLVEHPHYYSKLKECALNPKKVIFDIEVNPSILPFQMIYGKYSEDFKNSSVGRNLALKGFPLYIPHVPPNGEIRTFRKKKHSDGRIEIIPDPRFNTPGNKYIEATRKFSHETASFLMQYLFNIKMRRSGKPNENEIITTPLGSTNRGIENKRKEFVSDTEFSKSSGKDQITKEQELVEVRKNSLRKLAIETIVASLLRPLYNMTLTEMDELIQRLELETAFPKIPGVRNLRVGRISKVAFANRIIELVDINTCQAGSVNNSILKNMIETDFATVEKSRYVRPEVKKESQSPITVLYEEILAYNDIILNAYKSKYTLGSPAPSSVGQLMVKFIQMVRELKEYIRKNKSPDNVKLETVNKVLPEFKETFSELKKVLNIK